MSSQALQEQLQGCLWGRDQRAGCLASNGLQHVQISGWALGHSQLAPWGRGPAVCVCLPQQGLWEGSLKGDVLRSPLFCRPVSGIPDARVQKDFNSGLWSLCL